MKPGVNDGFGFKRPNLQPCDFYELMKWWEGNVELFPFFVAKAATDATTRGVGGNSCGL